jgi:amino acid transporter
MESLVGLGVVIWLVLIVIAIAAWLLPFILAILGLKALRRIGDELYEIRYILQSRIPLANGSPPPQPRPPD